MRLLCLSSSDGVYRNRWFDQSPGFYRQPLAVKCYHPAGKRFSTSNHNNAFNITRQLSISSGAKTQRYNQNKLFHHNSFKQLCGYWIASRDCGGFAAG